MGPSLLRAVRARKFLLSSARACISVEQSNLPMANTRDQLCINAIRFLSVDAVQKANSSGDDSDS